jgi:hypothetical protein
VCDLVREPKREQVRLEAQPLGVRIGDAGKVLKTDEGGGTPSDHQLAGIRGADADHQHHIDINVGLDQPCAPLFRRPGQGDNIGAGEHRTEVGPGGVDRSLDDIAEMRPIGVDDVVMPVGLQQAPVGVEVPLVSGDPVDALENREEIREQVDEHGRRAGGYPLGAGGCGRQAAAKV